MPFDFNNRPLHLGGLWPLSLAPVQIDVYGLCQMACFYCFSNLNRLAASRNPNLKNPTAALMNQLDRSWEDPEDAVGWHLREGYFAAMSNATDPFQRAEKEHRSTETVLKWMLAHNCPVYFQTKGNVLYEEWERYRELVVSGKDAVYLSLSMLDDRLRRKLEPGALSVSKRLDLVERLIKHGVPVIVACNPYVQDWLPDLDAYCRELTSRGVRDVFVFQLHFTAKQERWIPDFYESEVRKANTLPCFEEPGMRRWQEAAARHGLRCWMSEYWDAAFGYPFGVSGDRQFTSDRGLPASGRSFFYFHDFANFLYGLSKKFDSRPVLFSWKDVEQFLCRAGLDNPTLKTSPFWYCTLNQSKDGYREWSATMPERTTLYNVLRWYWNHPWITEKILWSDPHVRAVYDRQTLTYECEEEYDLVGVFLPRVLSKDPNLTISRDEFEFAAAFFPEEFDYDAFFSAQPGRPQECSLSVPPTCAEPGE